MITQKAFHLYFKQINLAYKFCFIPICYNEKTSFVEEGKNETQRFFWKLNVLCLWSYYIWLICRFFHTFIGDGERQAVSIIIHVAWIGMYTAVAVVDLTFVMKSGEIIGLVNSLIVFNERMKEQLEKEAKKISFDILKEFFRFSSASIFGNPIATSFLIFSNPCGQRFFSSVLADDCKHMTFRSQLGYYFVEVYYFSHACIATYVLIFTIPLVQFCLMDALKGLIRQPLKKECCIELLRHSKIYRQMQIINIRFHDCFQHFFFPAVTVSGVICTVIPLTGLVRLHDILGVAGILGLPVLAFGGITVLSALMFVTGRCVKLSGEDLFGQWKHADRCCKTKWMNKFRLSCAPIRCSLGQFFTIKTTTVLQSAHMCAEQTANLILMF